MIQLLKQRNFLEGVLCREVFRGLSIGKVEEEEVLFIVNSVFRYALTAIL